MAKAHSLIALCRDQISRNLNKYAFDAEYESTFRLVEAYSEELRNRVFGLRHRIFCEEYGYETPAAPASYKEIDEFDERSIHFLLQHCISHEMVGTLRVTLPNDERPGESFLLQKLTDHPLLKMDSRTLCLCEISRFAVVTRFRKRSDDGRLLPSYYDQEKQALGSISYKRWIPYPQAALLRGAFETILNARILDCVWMLEPVHLRSLQQIGFSYRILGPEIDYHGGMQPIIFNVKHTLDSMRDCAPHCWTMISDHGRLQDMANNLHRNDWSDGLFEELPMDPLISKANSDWV